MEELITYMEELKISLLACLDPFGMSRREALCNMSSILALISKGLLFKDIELNLYINSLSWMRKIKLNNQNQRGSFDNYFEPPPFKS